MENPLLTNEAIRARRTPILDAIKQELEILKKEHDEVDKELKEAKNRVVLLEDTLDSLESDILEFDIVSDSLEALIPKE